MPHHENIFPAPDTLNEMEYGRFVLANLAAKRAKQIKEGAPPLVRISSNHPLSIALAEIAAGKIKPILASEQHVPVEAHDDLVTLGSLDLGDDGLLLPALNDEEAEALGSSILGGGYSDDDEHDEDEEGGGAASLSDMLEDEEPPEVEVVASEDEPISLTDLASEEEEASGEDESSDV